ncbi:MAG: hypothetical protein JW780_05030 [Clostridiales bacterium]|nr:hypothetical protein [Clostridiales bacterium]
MNLLPTIRYNTQDIVTKTIPIYYGVFAVLFFLLCVASKIPDLNIQGTFSGNTFNSVVLVLVLGLSLTRGSFRMLTQMGISRKTQIVSKAIGILLVSAIIVLADRLFSFIVSLLFRSTVLTYESSNLMQILFGTDLTSFHPVQSELIAGALEFFLRVLIFSASVFIAMLYFRMNTFLKVIVSVGVPLSVIVGLPLGFRFFPDLMRRFVGVLGDITGIAEGNPIKMIVFLAILSIGVFGLYILTARRAPVKD